MDNTDRLADVTTFSGGIPYRVQNGYPKIEITEDKTTATEQILIRSWQAKAFALQSFPPPVIRNRISYRPQKRALPGTWGAGSLLTQKVTFEPFTNRPWDPLFVDLTNQGAYDDLCLVTIEYASERASCIEQDIDDPTTVMERSITAGGQFLSIPPNKLRVQNGDVFGRVDDNCGIGGAGIPFVAKNAGAAHPQWAGVDDGDGVPWIDGSPSVAPAPEYQGTGFVECYNVDGQGVPTADCGPVPGSDTDPTLPGGSEEDPEPNQDQKMPCLLTIPTAEITASWPLVLSPRIDRYISVLGRVNTNRSRLLFNASPETCLFTRFSASQKFIWNGATTCAQPWDLEFGFSHRVVREEGFIYGWNHVYSPDSGCWKRVYRANGYPLHWGFNVDRFFAS